MSAQTQRKSVSPIPDAIAKIPSNTLIVGDLARWEAEGRMTAPFDDIKFVEIKSLTAEIVQNIEPEIILSPLVADDFDAVDVAAKLIEIQFNGKYRAISDELPNADLIRSEIKSVAPQLDFDLLLMATAR